MLFIRSVRTDFNQLFVVTSAPLHCNMVFRLTFEILPENNISAELYHFVKKHSTMSASNLTLLKTKKSFQESGAKSCCVRNYILWDMTKHSHISLYKRKSFLFYCFFHPPQFLN